MAGTHPNKRIARKKPKVCQLAADGSDLLGRRTGSLSRFKGRL
jgi:hypothetical protein